MSFELDYSTDPDEILIFQAVYGGSAPLKHFYNISSNHPGTSLDLNLRGDFVVAPKTQKIFAKHDASYKRKFFAKEFGNIELVLDLEAQNFEYKKETRISSSYLGAFYEGMYPWYRLNTTKKENEDLFESGQFYLNLEEKFVDLEYNLTEDGTQNFNLEGKIPDSRSAYFYVYRNYDDIRLDDITYNLGLVKNFFLNQNVEEDFLFHLLQTATS